GLDRLAIGAKAERVFLRLLDAFTAQGRYVSASPGPTYAPAMFASHPEVEGCTKRALKGAMDALFGRDKIEVATHGKGAKARSHLARKGADHAQE
ncbi:MAG: ATPase, partial [Albidovulum sp.]